MSYVVNWQQADGSAGWEAAGEIGDAVAHVEALRNAHGVEGARIFRLDEVSFQLRPYFRVELADPAPVPVAAPVAPAPEAEPSEESKADGSWVEAAWPEPTDAAAGDTPERTGDVAANGTARRGLFGR